MGPRRLRALLACVTALFAVACSSQSSSGSTPTTPSATNNTTTSGAGGAATTPSDVHWEFNGQNWQTAGTPPPCPSPISLAAPTDLSRVTSILYPGQTRGGDYKPHGGFRLDGPGQTNDVAVTATLSGSVYRGARYTVNGEIQYTFDFINPCGIMFRVGHLRDLVARFQQLADAFPPPLEGDSHTTNVPSGQTVAVGETIAAAVGIRATNNVFFDFGVYDLRARNAASADPAWFAAHPGDVAPYAICWLDLVSGSGASIVRALPPGDGVAGKTSDVCR